MNTKRMMKTEFLMLIAVLLSLEEDPGSNKRKSEMAESKYVTVKCPAGAQTVNVFSNEQKV